MWGRARAVAGREAGNSVVIEHGEGWETQYAHLSARAGLAGAVPVVETGLVDRERLERLSTTSGAALFWVLAYGVQAGERGVLRVTRPDGEVLVERGSRIEANRAQWLAFVGRRMGAADWPRGIYRGEYRLYRGEEQREVLSVFREVNVAAPGTAALCGMPARKSW